MRKQLKDWMNKILGPEIVIRESISDSVKAVAPPAENLEFSRSDYKPLRILVTTTCLSTGKVSERIVDHNNPEQRGWLGRHCHWAFRNQHSITTTPI